MAAASVIRLEDYLRTSYEGPDPEFVHGRLVERCGASYQHGRVKQRLCVVFHQLEAKHRLFSCPELRTQVAPGIVRVPDLAVFAGNEPVTNPVSEKPLVVVEIASPEDRISQVLEKLEEYQTAGIPHIWFIDPEHRAFYAYNATGLQRADAFRLSSYCLAIQPADLDL